MTVESFGEEPVEWQVVKKKKGGKSRQKELALVPEDPPSSRTSKREYPCSPSMLSVRSGCSTKDTETLVDEHGSLPDSPTMLSCRSETSTEVPSAALDESALIEELRLLEASASGDSLDGWQQVPSKGSKKLARGAKRSPETELVVPSVEPLSPQISGALSHAFRQCNQKDEFSKLQQRKISARSSDPAGETRATLKPVKPMKLSCSSVTSVALDEETLTGEAVSQSLAKSILECESTTKSLRPPPPPEKVTTVSKDKVKNRAAAIENSVAKKSIVDGECSSMYTIPQVVSNRKVAKSKSRTEKSSTKARSKVNPEPLHSSWVHNGLRDDNAEWRFLTLQPLWIVAAPDLPHIPVSVEVVEDRRLVIKQTFLHLEPTQDCGESVFRRRAHSLDPILLRKKSC